ncbi:MAG: M18 family aminopeptidase [Lachnospiraceae bacterium]|nr:M18 family aminopeptidase [Lachnospiraceae bacterium]
MQATNNLIEFITDATCSFTTVLAVEKTLQDKGFKQLNMQDDWKKIESGKYYVKIYDSTLMAFTVGNSLDKSKGIRIAACHTDSPALYIKPNPEMATSKYGKLNVDVYGGPILNTWLDRPLSVSGRITYKSEDIFKPNIKIVDFKDSICTIPNMAIHINRDVNKGFELNRQTDMAPLCAYLEDELSKENFFMKYIEEKTGIPVEDILDYEFYVYNNDKPEYVGLDKEYLSAPRIDNTSSVMACLNGIINVYSDVNVNVSIFYDNEEIGSRTKQGADSTYVSMVLEKLYIALGYAREEYINAIMNGFYLSLDVAHGHHPNHPEKTDPTNVNMLNEGIVIKRAANQSYGTDSVAIGVIEQICKSSDIKYQKYSCRSDGTTGSTLGAIANKYLPMHLVDVGIPILAMHSARELMGVKDQQALNDLVGSYFIG